ncbi:MAG: GtrA family protein, partial [Actinobacteria bacterium]
MLTVSQTTRLSRAARFGAVGAVGLVVNLGAQAALIEGFGVNYLAAAVIATQISSTVNFALAESWVFGAGGRSDGRAGRYVAFLAMNNVALLLRGPIMWMLTSGLGVHYAVSNLTSLVVLTLIRFGIADSVIWRVPRTATLATVPSGPATLVTVGAPFSVVDVSARATAQMKLPPPRPVAARAGATPAWRRR